MINVKLSGLKREERNKKAGSEAHQLRLHYPAKILNHISSLM